MFLDLVGDLNSRWMPAHSAKAIPVIPAGVDRSDRARRLVASVS
jgi:hypothetical protein